MDNVSLAGLEQRLHRTLPDARIEVTALPGLPDLRLGLINADFPTGPLPPDVMHAVIAEPAYWAFCWGSGLAVAQWLKAHPGTVAGKRVADLGSGSGVVAIAARQAGASAVYACDNDADALYATRVNAALNEVTVEAVADIAELPADLDVLFMADVLYDRSNFALIELAKPLAARLTIADSRVTSVEDEAFRISHRAEALTYPNLGEFDEFRNVQFFDYVRQLSGWERETAENLSNPPR